MAGDSNSVDGTAAGGGKDRLFGGGGPDSLVGDSHSIFLLGDVAGAGDDLLDAGPGPALVIGDSDGRKRERSRRRRHPAPGRRRRAAVGDHNVLSDAIGAGDDALTGSGSGEALIGDSSADGSITAAGDDRITGREGEDTLFGDNSDFDVPRTIGKVGGGDKLDGGLGDDTLRAGPANDDLDGGESTDDCDREAGTRRQRQALRDARWRSVEQTLRIVCSRQAGEAELIEVLDRFCSGFTSRDADAILSVCALEPNLIVVTSEEPLLRGPDELRGFLDRYVGGETPTRGSGIATMSRSPDRSPGSSPRDRNRGDHGGRRAPPLSDDAVRRG